MHGKLSRRTVLSRASLVVHAIFRGVVQNCQHRFGLIICPFPALRIKYLRAWPLKTYLRILRSPWTFVRFILGGLASPSTSVRWRLTVDPIAAGGTSPLRFEPVKGSRCSSWRTVSCTCHPCPDCPGITHGQPRSLRSLGQHLPRAVVLASRG